MPAGWVVGPLDSLVDQFPRESNRDTSQAENGSHAGFSHRSSLHISLLTLNRLFGVSAAAGNIQTGRKHMRHPLHSEASQIGPRGRLPGSATPSSPQSIDTATLELLSIWQREDATTDPAQLQAAE